jgi:hypothetical protein
VALENALPGMLEISYTRDPQTTGNFDVTIVNNGALIYSKTKFGQGKCTEPAEREAVIEKEFLNSK